MVLVSTSKVLARLEIFLRLYFEEELRMRHQYKVFVHAGDSQYEYESKFQYRQPSAWHRSTDYTLNRLGQSRLLTVQ